MALTIALVGCVSGSTIPSPEADAARSFAVGPFRVAAEGTCARLSVAALGTRRVLVYGDTGYDLAGWLPDDEVPAAQSLAVFGVRGAGRDERLLEGLPRDDRGYVPGSLEVGGSDDANGWLLRVTTRYAPGGVGALFARTSQGYRLGPRGWSRVEGSPVERPRSVAGLPDLPTSACGDGATFVPLASATTRGGVMVAGRCDDARIPNPPAATLLVAHGRPSAISWEMRRVPGTENLDGIVNVAIDARTDGDAALVAWEPFVPLEKRRSFAARWDGSAWGAVTLGVPGGYLDVAHEAPGALLVVNGRGAYRVDAAGRVTRLALPAPASARGAASDVYVRAAHVFDREVWIETSYRVWPARDRPAVWASALLTNAAIPRPIHCDASEPADRALAETE
jgi:hypothetical protein